jgi:hypothetical protein
VGIIMVLIGAWVTQKYGLDGSMRLLIGESQEYVTLPETVLKVYGTLDGDSYRELFAREVDFYMNPPTREKPFVVTLGQDTAEVIDYMPFAAGQVKTMPSKTDTDPPGLRFQLENQNVNHSQWLLPRTGQKQTSADLGPAQVILSKTPWAPSGKNEIAAWPSPNPQEIEYVIYSKEKKKIKAGRLSAGQSVETGWMGLVFRVLDYMPHAREEMVFKPLDRPTEVSTSAIQVKFRGQEHWVGLNSLLKLFENNMGFILAYQNKLIKVGFPLSLLNFEIGRYQGTMRAASYQSLVNVPNLGQHLISMNEPLKHNGYTFYQASFEQDEQGAPTASILSVNHDPGRGLKYGGSLLIVFGTIIMFYFKRKRAKASAREKGVAA